MLRTLLEMIMLGFGIYTLYRVIRYKKFDKTFLVSSTIFFLMIISRAGFLQYSEMVDSRPYVEGVSCQSEFDTLRTDIIKGITISGSVDSAYEQSLLDSLVYASMAHKDLVEREETKSIL